MERSKDREEVTYDQQPVVQYKTYPGRFYVLAVTALLAMHQNIAWLTFGPITSQATQYYGLTDVELTLLPEYSPISFMLFTIPFTWFLYRYGLRIVTLVGAWMLAVGCGIRVFVPFVPHAREWIWVMHLGHIIIGLVGLPIMIIPSKVSSVWFPVNQRSFATAITTNAQGFGSGFGFLMITYLTEQFGIRTMLYVQAEIALFVAILATIYFPAEPPTPPSHSAEEDRDGFLLSLKKLLFNKNFILLVVSGGIVVGAVFSIGSVIGIVLNPSSGFNNLVVVNSVQEFFYSVAWMGAFAQITGTVAGQITGFFADRFQKKFKLILLILLSGGAASSLWFSLSLYGWGSSNPINYFFTFAIMNVCILASFPIFYEAVVECTYPVSEGTSVGILALTINAGSLLFGIIGMSKIFSTAHPDRAKVMTWVVTGFAVISIILVLLFSDKYHRLTVDKSPDKHHTITNDGNIQGQSTPIVPEKTESPPSYDSLD